MAKPETRNLFDHLYGVFCNNLRELGKASSFCQLIKNANSDLNRITALSKVCNIVLLIKSVKKSMRNNSKNAQRTQDILEVYYAKKEQCGDSATDLIALLNSALASTEIADELNFDRLNDVVSNEVNFIENLLVNSEEKSPTFEELLLSEIHGERSIYFYNITEYEMCLLEALRGIYYAKINRNCPNESLFPLLYLICTALWKLNHLDKASNVLQLSVRLLRISSLYNAAKSLQTVKLVKLMKVVQASSKDGGCKADKLNFKPFLERTFETIPKVTETSDVVMGACSSIELKRQVDRGRHIVATQTIPLVRLVSENDVFLVPPTIIQTLSNEETLEPQSNFSIGCVAEYPITWQPFQGFDGRYEIDHIVEEGQYYEYDDGPWSYGHRYISIIHLTNVSHHFVGYFYCVANSTQDIYDYSWSFEIERERYKELEKISGEPNFYGRESDSPSGLTKIYIFVNDPQHLLAPFGLQNGKAIRQRYQSVAISIDHDLLHHIPCKPTSENVEVNLFEDGKKLRIARPIYYLNKIGFWIGFTSAEEIYGRTFACVPDSLSDSQIFFAIRYHTPKIESATGLYGTKGEQLKLNCSTVVRTGEKVAIEWKLPNASLKETRVVQSELTIQNHPTRPSLQIGMSEILIRNVDKVMDEGLYECEAINELRSKSINRIFIEILEKGDDALDIRSMDGIYGIEIRRWQTAIWKVKFKGRPKPTIDWYNPSGKIILRDEKWEVEVTNDSTVLKILSVELEDSGFYTLKASNGVSSMEKKFELLVKVGPIVEVPNVVSSANEIAKLVCNCKGYPPSTITWIFKPCQWKGRVTLSDCEENYRSIEGEYVNTTSESLSTQTSVAMLNVTQAGKAKCTATNSEGVGSAKLDLHVTDIESGLFDVWRLNDETEIFAGDNVTIFCAVSLHVSSEITWFLNDLPVQSSDDMKVESLQSKYSFQKSITWNAIKTSHSGTYECHMINELQSYLLVIKKLVIKVYEPQKPVVDNTVPAKVLIEVQLDEPSRLTCNIIGDPRPNIQWHKNEELISNGTKYRLSDDMKTLEINKTDLSDGGNFNCTATNRYGSVHQIVNLTVKNRSSNVAWIIGAIVLTTLVFIIVSVYAVLRIRKLRHELDATYVINLDGNPAGINPDLPLHEQVDFLSYDKQYEFPKQNLKLGKMLGYGAYGVVLKGLAIGILPTEDETVVAVKKLKQTAGNEEIVALVTELKIMVHMGRHLNVVNLLGAVTKNMKRELMLIVEFCRFGNLQTFLAENRNLFVDQVNIKNDSIDPTIVVAKERSHLKYIRPCFSHSRSDRTYQENDEIMEETNDTVVGASVNSIMTTDLVCWLFQIARGMEYLSSRKVLHGDLAARNVLLCDGNVVKICDFGLARSIYKYCNYVKQGQTPLPFKWLAIESIRDQIFSTFTDVWSFGVLMWELFTLGQTPYPGMNADNDLFAKLRDGYRMDKPEYATKEIYYIMLNCWNVNPETRPTFNDLQEKFGKLLQDGQAEHYIDLNQQYVAMKPNYFKQSETDYKALLGSPETMAPLLHTDETNI